jgi:hypothetical protein
MVDVMKLGPRPVEEPPAPPTTSEKTTILKETNQ